jgi:hypothetical protein
MIRGTAGRGKAGFAQCWKLKYSKLEGVGIYFENYESYRYETL